MNHDDGKNSLRRRTAWRCSLRIRNGHRNSIWLTNRAIRLRTRGAALLLGQRIQPLVSVDMAGKVEPLGSRCVGSRI